MREDNRILPVQHFCLIFKEYKIRPMMCYNCISWCIPLESLHFKQHYGTRTPLSWKLFLMHAIGAAAAAGSRQHGRHSDGDPEAALLAGRTRTRTERMPSGDYPCNKVHPLGNEVNVAESGPSHPHYCRCCKQPTDKQDGSDIQAVDHFPLIVIGPPLAEAQLNIRVGPTQQILLKRSAVIGQGSLELNMFRLSP
ncbi:hypothetical protein EYF80_010884 [Liparis tanakae]|uniref:Uncharacterized protein n=1 Tax=Liparis tanakae TaxID=230148 RepID=A0A4Z2IMK4_9TELE|nr:hypothetical protein EYF80_010884 [Liparis tanakae]